MNISALTSINKRNPDLDQVQSTLQSGNITAAQTAFAGFLQGIQQTQGTSAGGTFSPGTQAAKDLQSLQGALHSADLSGARRACSNLAQDLQGDSTLSAGASALAAGKHPSTLFKHHS